MFLRIFFDDDGEGFDTYDLVGSMSFMDGTIERRDDFKLEVHRKPLHVCSVRI